MTAKQPDSRPNLTDGAPRRLGDARAENPGVGSSILPLSTISLREWRSVDARHDQATRRSVSGRAVQPAASALRNAAPTPRTNSTTSRFFGTVRPQTWRSKTGTPSIASAPELRSSSPHHTRCETLVNVRGEVHAYLPPEHYRRLKLEAAARQVSLSRVSALLAAAEARPRDRQPPDAARRRASPRPARRPTSGPVARRRGLPYGRGDGASPRPGRAPSVQRRERGAP